ncbi:MULTISPECIES: SOS response-associated peptidase family protein [unclassified Novosphingobium]|uniref:SOS response-associated peptidase family protein n=1 Tax=unclassified Novosphingobium TaxID=2644732 RepID=UPI000D418BC8|nr:MULTISPECIES: SOS response-associated peptidase family protein [unclassified Novosphingobium]PTR06475.1 putative SOS response-associated peptidase YedK [Novosphingobium sp. GV055]PUA94894.1 putative SOS response-associated peptidase YedK [Novosphingobium sp. GV061]PUB13819.1 putative SOS response-associated peptidase YedK [Novosphingobium sp. GV079]PUB38517.1 putative SOS response-associated peptidase YedK [Novosphingobium sp. GV027]
MRIAPPDHDRLTRLALETVSEAAAEAQEQIVDVTWGIRLALRWLMISGVIKDWHVRQFVEAIGSPIRDAYNPHVEWRSRADVAARFVDFCHQQLGLPCGFGPPQRHRERRWYDEMLDPDTGRAQPWLMCNRYRPGERETIRQHFGAKMWRETNDGPAIVHPKDPGWVVRQVDGALVLDQMTWGFPVVLTGRRGQPLKPKPVNNARMDKLGGFWKRWTGPEHRCLIPAMAYAEAVGPSGEMTTTWLSIRSMPVFAWAGLWRDSEEWGPVYTGVMTDNAPELAHVHDRSPVILAPEDWPTWLSGPADGLAQFDRPWPAADVIVDATPVRWRDGGR